MHELFNVEGQSIYTFKAGDIIYRTKTLEHKKQMPHDNLPIIVEVVTSVDSSFRKEPIEFICIKNNLVYLRNLKEDYDGARRIVTLILPEWESDWAIYEVPEGLTIEDCISW